MKYKIILLLTSLIGTIAHGAPMQHKVSVPLTTAIGSKINVTLVKQGEDFAMWNAHMGTSATLSYEAKKLSSSSDAKNYALKLISTPGGNLPAGSFTDRNLGENSWVSTKNKVILGTALLVVQSGNYVYRISVTEITPDGRTATGQAVTIEELSALEKVAASAIHEQTVSDQGQ